MSDGLHPFTRDEKFIAEVKEREGFKNRPYKDTRGYWSIGYGEKLTRERAEEYAKMGQMPEPVAFAFMQKGIDREIRNFNNAIANDTENDRPYKNMSDFPLPIQHVIADMAYNMGGAGAAKFVKALAAGYRGDWQDMIFNLENNRNKDGTITKTKWFTQVPNRVKDNQAAIVKYAVSQSKNRVGNADQVPR